VAKGFTLIELLVVLVIMGLLLVAAPIAFDRALPSLQVRSDARDLASTLREARSRAILRNREVTVTVDVEERSYRLDDDGERQHFSDNIAVTLKTVASEVLGPDTGRIRFFPDGTSTGGLVTLDRRGRLYEIEVDWLYGRVRILE
jgi:general secretion pathway protein H